MDRESIDSVLRSLRRVNLQGSLFGQTVAIRFGLSESDVEALEVLLDTGAATAGKLSDLMGLTTGAVTRVIDRLEQAGYVRRVPDPADRRRVVVELIPDRMAAVEATMARVGDKSATEIGHYSAAELAVINDFLTRMEAITRRGGRCAPGDAGDGGRRASQHVAPIGGLTRARLLFKAGAHELLLRGFADPDDLYRATVRGQVPHVRLRDGTVTIGYKGRWLWDALDRRTDVLLNRQIPWDIELAGGAGKLQGKLADVDLRSFQLIGRGRSAPADARPTDRRGGPRPDPGREQGPHRATDRRARPPGAQGRGRPDRLRSPARRWDRRHRRSSRRGATGRRPLPRERHAAAPARSPSPRSTDRDRGRIRRRGCAGRGGPGTRRGSGRGSGTGRARTTWS